MPLFFDHKYPSQTFKRGQLLMLLLALVGNNTAHAVLSTGLVAHYCFDDKVNLGKDCSGQGNDGVVQGRVSYVSGGIIDSGGAQFGGIKKRGDIFVKNSASLKFNQALSVSAFIKITDPTGMDGTASTVANGTHAILAKSHSNRGFWMNARIDNANKFTTDGGNNFYVKPSFSFGRATSMAVKKATWIHVVYVIANGVAKIYYDGVLVNTTEKGVVDFTLANQENLYIGKYSDKWYPSNAIMDDIRLYNRALTDVEIQTLALPTSISRLNDTGITTCSNEAPCPQAGFPGQDAEFGRDVTNNNNVDGHAGFSFTKISSAGATLAATATSWNCVKDNVTGLMWEVKTNDNGLHDQDWTYTWYEPDNSKNGGTVGRQNGGNCGTTSVCDTDGYVKAVNETGWCGFKDWRVPRVDELSGITALDRIAGVIDTNYFPNLVFSAGDLSTSFWSSSPAPNVKDVGDGYGSAWYVDFYLGDESFNNKYFDRRVRLVRGGQ